MLSFFRHFGVRFALLHISIASFFLFVLTGDPVAVFGKAHGVVINQGVPNVMRSAYREMDREDYVILWPSSLTEFRVL